MVLSGKTEKEKEKEIQLEFGAKQQLVHVIGIII